jgi:hypothetical protein
VQDDRLSKRLSVAYEFGDAVVGDGIVQFIGSGLETAAGSAIAPRSRMTTNWSAQPAHFQTGRDATLHALRQPHCGQYGSPPLSAQRMRWKAALATSSDVRATALSESVLAAA